MSILFKDSTAGNGLTLPLITNTTASPYIHQNVTVPSYPKTETAIERLSAGIDEAMLQSEVFNTPIDTLANVWTTKYGDRWVDLDEIINDAFFSLAYKRLHQRGLIETHYLTNRAKYVCRIPEH